MAAKRDYYEILGVSRNADGAAIKKAYRKLAKRCHPDTNEGDTKAEERFKEATEAYEILSDPEKRKLYDRFGHRAFDGTGNAGEEFSKGFGYGFYGGTHGYKEYGNGYQEYHFDGDNFEDILKNIFGDGFDSFHGHIKRRKGQDLHAQMSVTFDEAVHGCEKVIHLADQNGGEQMLKVKIPAGIDSGKSIRLRGKGEPGINGGEAGDLLLEVTVEEKTGFKRKGMDVYTTIQIPYTTAVFGGEVIVETLYGKVLCKIAEGTQSGSKIRIRGKGIVSMKNPNVRGDQYAAVQIQVPKYINPMVKQKLREYAQAMSVGKTA